MTVYNSINNATAPGARNLFLGLTAGNNTLSPTFCTDNTYVGYGAGASIDNNQSNNTFIGSMAGNSATVTSDNTAVGFNAYLSGSSVKNTAVGSDALSSVTSGFFNTVYGYNAGANYSGNESSNVCLNHIGTFGASHELRLGTDGSGVGQQNTCYIAGIVPAAVTDQTGYDIVLINPSTTQTVAITQANFGTKITTYSTPGNYTWTKDARTKLVTVLGFCGGSGGGSGRKGGSGAATGGAGGNAGSSFLMQVPAMFLNSTESLSVGAGGNGGPAQATDSTDGNPGSVGGQSFFSNFKPLLQSFGAGGNSTTAPGNSSTHLFIYNQLITSGAASGGTGSLTTGGNGLNTGYGITTGPMTATSGGGGAGNGLTSGGGGGNILLMDGSGTFLGGGVGGSLSAGSPGNNAPTTTAGGLIVGGTGGGGGAASFAGGLGGTPGGGGGGGGAGLDATYSSGAGGGGGNGLIIVIESM